MADNGDLNSLNKFPLPLNREDFKLYEQAENTLIELFPDGDIDRPQEHLPITESGERLTPREVLRQIAIVTMHFTRDDPVVPESLKERIMTLAPYMISPPILHSDVESEVILSAQKLRASIENGQPIIPIISTPPHLKTGASRAVYVWNLSQTDTPDDQYDPIKAIEETSAAGWLQLIYCRVVANNTTTVDIIPTWDVIFVEDFITVQKLIQSMNAFRNPNSRRGMFSDPEANQKIAPWMQNSVQKYVIAGIPRAIHSIGQFFANLITTQLGNNINFQLATNLADALRKVGLGVPDVDITGNPWIKSALEMLESTLREGDTSHPEEQ